MADNVIVRVPEQQFIRGEDGYSPEVTIEDIAHGHSVTITDRDHPTGQSFPVLDGDSAYEQAVAGGYTGTEAQFNEELASFKELSEQAADSANTAAGAAFRAQNYERHAGDAEDAARAYADIALIRMNSADQSAQNAASSASNASRDAGTASAAATTATEKAGEASDSATAADGSAKDAEAYAIGKRNGTDVGSTDPAYHNNAKYYAEQAASSASDAVTAKGAAETAQGKAEDAQEAAEQAQEAAEAVLESIPSDYTELSDDVDDLKSDVTLYTGNAQINFVKDKYIVTSGSTVDITSPVNSSTGYGYAVIDCSEGDKFTVTSSGGQNPRAWCFIDASGNSLSKADANVAVNNAVITAPANSAKLVINAKYATEKSYYGEFLANRLEDLNDTVNSAIDSSNSAVETLKGDISNTNLSSNTITAENVFVEDTINGSNLSRLFVDVKFLQSGEGTPSPTNRRPISGYSSISIEKKAKNILNIPYVKSGTNVQRDTIKTSNVTYTINRNKDGSVESIIANGTASGDSNLYFAIDAAGTQTYDIGESGKQYRFTALPSAGSATTFRATVQNVGNDYGTGVTFTGNFRGFISISVLNGYTANNLVFRPMICLAEEDVVFAPYGSSYIASIPSEYSPLYGAKYNALTGELWITHMAITNSTQRTWNWNSSKRIAWTPVGTAVSRARMVDASSNSFQKQKLISCDILESGSWSLPYNFVNMDYSCSAYYGRGIAIHIAGLTTLSEYKTWINENNPVFVYPLEEPLKIQASKFSDIPVYNSTSIHTDCGNTSVNYILDNSKSLHIKEPDNLELLMENACRDCSNIYPREPKECQNTLCLLHFTDVHGDVTSVKRILNFYNKHSKYIHDILHTGDVVDSYSDSSPLSISGANIVLEAIGNHECLMNGDSGSHPYNVTAEEAYSKFIEPYIESWGVQSAGEDLCYYYKDYGISKIRLIVLDAIHFDSQQLDWFAGVLNDAITNNLAVVAVTHYQARLGLDLIPCTFNTYGQEVPPYPVETPTEQSESMPDSAFEAVDSFIENGGEFVCWLSGHWHRDFVGTVKGYGEQIQILLSTAYNLKAGNDDSTRAQGTQGQDCFNIFVADRNSKCIKIIRIGSSVNKYMQSKSTLCINYETTQVISNT